MFQAGREKFDVKWRDKITFNSWKLLKLHESYITVFRETKRENTRDPRCNFCQFRVNVARKYRFGPCFTQPVAASPRPSFRSSDINACILHLYPIHPSATGVFRLACDLSFPLCLSLPFSLSKCISLINSQGRWQAALERKYLAEASAYYRVRLWLRAYANMRAANTVSLYTKLI